MKLQFQLSPTIELKQVDPSMAAEIFQTVDRNRAHLRPWLAWVDKTATVSDIEEYLAFCERALATGCLTLAIFESGRFAGLVSHHAIDPKTRMVPIGYCIDEAFQGKGLIRESVRFLVDHTFNSLPVDQIQVRTATDNGRSEKIPRSLGFQFHEVLPEAQVILGKPQDLKVFVMERQAWEKSQRLHAQTAGAIDLRVKGDAPRALSILEPLLKQSPNDAALNYQVAWTLDVLGHESQAAVHYERALSSDLSGKDRLGALLGLGSTYRCMGALEQSLEIFNQTIAEYPANRPLRVFRALTLGRLGKAEEAFLALLNELLDTSSDPEILSYDRALRGYSQAKADLHSVK